MFINLTARKDNGDFYITSSDVVQEAYPDLNDAAVERYLIARAREYFMNGWNVELTQREEA